jgi:hypothetical protein
MNPMRIRIALSFLPLAACLAHAAPQARDLGLGLLYRRVLSIPADLPPAGEVGGHPCVLDLRFADGNRTAAGALAAWLRAQCSPATPVFLLANAGTNPLLLAWPTGPVPFRGLVVLGPASPGFKPDIAIEVSLETDRRACAALDKGAALASLIDNAVDKPRNDEARLAREHLSDSASGDDDDGGADLQLDRPEPPRPLTDAVLRRAVQLHRALLALKRL